MVAAGLVIGNKGRNFGMSESTRERLDGFWELLDEILNAVLFMLIGLEIIVISVTGPDIVLGAIAVAAVLMGRVVSISLPLALMSLGRRILGWKPVTFLTASGLRRFGLPARLAGLSQSALEWRTVALLTWGGLRGGLSIAMALSLPDVPEKTIILPMTYIVVLFAILVQGLSFKPMLKYLVKA